MPIPILCPCKAKLRVRDALAGLEIQCPKCLVVHPVPGETPTNGKAHHSPAPAVGNGKQILAKSGLSPSERERLDKELEEGERLLWAAKPDRKGPFLIGWIAAGASCFFALILLVMMILMMVQKIGGFAGVVLGPIAFVLIVGGLVFPFLNRRRYDRTAYALTDRRALVWDCDWMARPRFKDYGPEDVAAYSKMQFSQRPDAVGHILFAREVTGQVGTGKVFRSHGFFYVAGVPQLEKLIRENLIDAYTDRLLS